MLKDNLVTLLGISLLIGIVIGGLGVWGLYRDQVRKAEEKAEERFYELLNETKFKYETQITTLQNLKSNLETVVSSTNLTVDSLNKAISTRNWELNRLKKEYNEKVSTINGMSNNGLTTFFTDRYN
tara:strand:- start:643 stop:1020 length:378 start_codon:yes stop_codon:yes gene_type:complete